MNSRLLISLLITNSVVVLFIVLMVSKLILYSIKNKRVKKIKRYTMD